MAKFEYIQRAFSSELKPRARLVLQVLVLHCNKEGECFPSIKAIAAKCGYGVSTVKRALDELVKAGYIVKQGRFDERKNGGQTSNLYTLCSDLPCTDEPENAPVPEDDSSDESPAVQPESAPADACNAPDPTPGEQSVTLPTADSCLAHAVPSTAWDHSHAGSCFATFRASLLSLRPPRSYAARSNTA